MSSIAACRLGAADAMAANELAVHASLLPPCVPHPCPHISTLLGGFVVKEGAAAGEQWLVFAANDAGAHSQPPILT